MALSLLVIGTLAAFVSALVVFAALLSSTLLRRTPGPEDAVPAQPGTGASPATPGVPRQDPAVDAADALVAGESAGRRDAAIFRFRNLDHLTVALAEVAPARVAQWTSAGDLVRFEVVAAGSSHDCTYLRGFIGTGLAQLAGETHAARVEERACVHDGASACVFEAWHQARVE